MANESKNSQQGQTGSQSEKTRQLGGGQKGSNQGTGERQGTK
jgi:hypothetical protein